MNCDGVRGLLSAYVDGELSAGELLRVEQHLRRCHWCADEVDALRQTIALVASLQEVEVPAAFHAQLHSRLVALGPPVQAGRTAVAIGRNSRPNYRRWAAPAAAAAALVIGLSSYNILGARSSRPENPAQLPVVTNGTPEASSQQVTVNLAGTGQQPEDKNTVGGSTSGDAPTSEKPSSDNPVIPPPAAQGPGPVTNTDTAPKTEVRPVSNPNPGAAHVATTLVNGLADPSTLPPQQHVSAVVVASAIDPDALVKAFQERFPGSTVNQAGTTIQVRATLPVAELEGAVRFVEELTGSIATLGSAELNTQLAALYQSLQQLDRDKQVQEAELANLTDETEKAAAKQFLTELSQSAEQLRQEYKRLQDMASTATISVTLKPSQAQ